VGNEDLLDGRLMGLMSLDDRSELTVEQTETPGKGHIGRYPDNPLINHPHTLPAGLDNAVSSGT
jgi:hypothetical protein